MMRVEASIVIVGCAVVRWVRRRGLKSWEVGRGGSVGALELEVELELELMFGGVVERRVCRRARA